MAAGCSTWQMTIGRGRERVNTLLLDTLNMAVSPFIDTTIDETSKLE